MSVVRLAEGGYRYVGEGNCSVVVALLDGSGDVVRLSKVGQLSTRDAEWRERVARPLFGARHVQPAERVELQVPRPFLDSLRAHRAASRLHRTPDCRYGVRQPDLTSDLVFAHLAPPTLCVELKCKRGRMPPPHPGKCAFCIKQYTKLEQNTVRSISRYCPLDLFSGDPARMSRAILHLVENPQNNFKMFIGGVPVPTDRIQTFLADYLSKHSTLSGDPLHAFTSILTSILLWDGVNSASDSLLSADCVLGRILRVQTLEPDLGDVPDDDDDESHYRYVDELLDLVDAHRHSDESEFYEFISRTATPLQKYMLACIANDCSVMVAFKPLMDGSVGSYRNDVKVNYGNVDFVAKIGIVDLDPKPSSKVKIHRERDAQRMQSFIRAINKSD